MSLSGDILSRLIPPLIIVGGIGAGGYILYKKGVFTPVNNIINTIAAAPQKIVDGIGNATDAAKQAVTDAVGDGSTVAAAKAEWYDSSTGDVKTDIDDSQLSQAAQNQKKTWESRTKSSTKSSSSSSWTGTHRGKR